MTSTTIVHPGPSPGDEFGLDVIARHNAQTSVEEPPNHYVGGKGLGIGVDDYGTPYVYDESYIANPPTPRSNTASEGIRTRSGRSTRGPTSSPYSTTKSRVSRSPAPRSKKEKKSKIDKSKTPKLTAPLSVLTKDMDIPVKDIESYVNRSPEKRRQEMEEKKYVTRPMNSFMLYRSAYAERTKAWCAQNNHQVVSSVSGESWPMEPDEIRSQFDKWAKIERQHHQEAHPDYKFSPSKANNKRRKGELSDDDDEPSDLDGDPDGEYRGSGRNVRQRTHAHTYATGNVGFHTTPYFPHQVSRCDQSQQQYINTGRPLPSNITYDHHGMSYIPQHYHMPTSYNHPQGEWYMSEMQDLRVSSPGSTHSQQPTVGNFGLPGGPVEEFFSSSRNTTPMQHRQPQYAHASYGQYPSHFPAQAFQPVSQAPTPQPDMHMYDAEHQRYLQQSTQPQVAIDPGLEPPYEIAAAPPPQGGDQLGHDHFDQAWTADDHAWSEAVADLQNYGQSTSPVGVDATLGQEMSPSALRKEGY